MGLDLIHVLSDERHHGAFVCVVCNELCGLDALVTVSCSHVFCKPCLEQWLTRSRKCPTCNTSLEYSRKDLPTIMMGDHAVHAAALKDAQPLAHRVLSRIQVRCPLHHKHGCPWVGDYLDLQQHLVSATAHLNLPATTTPTISSNHNSESEMKVETIVEGDDEKDGEEMMDEAEETPQPSHRALALSFKEEANGKFVTNNYAQARDLYSKGLSVLLGVVKSTVGGGSNNDDDKQLMAQLYCNRAACHMKLQQYVAAADDCSAALRLDSKYVKARLRQSHTLVELGKFDEAVTTLQEGLTLQQNEKNKPISPLLKRELVKKQQLAKIWTNAVTQLEEKHDYASAKSLFGSLLRDSKAPPIVLGAAQSDLGLGLTDSALRLSLQVLRKHPNYADAYVVRGQCMYFMADDLDGATKLLREALRLDPDSAKAKRAWKQCKAVHASLQQARKAVFYRRFQEAIDLFTSAMEAAGTARSMLPAKSPLYSILYTERAEAHLRLQQYQAALKDVNLVLYAREDTVKAWQIKCKAYHGLGRHEDARDELAHILERWGSGEESLRKAYERADFEVRKAARPDFYKLLDVPTMASLMEIKKQYKVKAMEYHPDRWSGPQYTDEQRKTAEENFKALGEGLEILSDDFKRQLYDEGYDAEAIRERVEAAQHAAHHRGGHHHRRHH